jgi:hypothetical protein
MTPDDARKWLGIDASAGPEEIRRAYVRSVREHRPEVDAVGFQRTREAYELLSGTGGPRPREDNDPPAPLPLAQPTTPAVGGEHGPAGGDDEPDEEEPDVSVQKVRARPTDPPRGATAEPQRRIEALMGGPPLTADLVKAILDWHDADERDPAGWYIAPLCVDVAMRLFAAARADEATAIATRVAQAIERHPLQDDTVQNRMRMRVQALAELVKLQGRIPAPVHAGLAESIATSGDDAKLEAEMSKAPEAARGQIWSTVQEIAPLLASLRFRKPRSEARSSQPAAGQSPAGPTPAAASVGRQIARTRRSLIAAVAAIVFFLLRWCLSGQSEVEERERRERARGR